MSCLSSTTPTPQKRVYSHLMDVSALTILEGLLVMALYAIYSAPVLANIVIFMICLHRTSNYWKPAITKTSHLETGNVQVSVSSSCYHAQIEIGGPQHSENWKENLHHSFTKALKTQSLCYDSKHFKADLVVHSHAPSSKKDLRNVLDMFSVEPRAGSSSRTPHLELNVEVVDDGSADDTVDQDSLEFTPLLNLRKLTWKGSYPDVFLSRSEDQTILFPHLTELCLTDCDLSSMDLVEIFSRCPSLTSFEVRQLRQDSRHTVSVDRQSSVLPSTTTTTTTTTTTPTTTPSLLTHPTLKHLRIASSLNLHDFFVHVRLPSVRSISLHITRSAPLEGPIHEHIARLRIPWSSMKYFDLIAPLNYYSVRYLKAFFDLEPALYSRTHSLSHHNL